jgi:hypothetical protein
VERVNERLGATIELALLNLLESYNGRRMVFLTVHMNCSVLCDWRVLTAVMPTSPAPPSSLLPPSPTYAQF